MTRLIGGLKTEATPARADLSNWRASPHSRWAFHNVDEIIASAPIDNDPATASAAPRGSAGLDGFQVTGVDGSRLDLEGFIQATATDALVVLIDGRIAHESYHRGTTVASPHILMSATKAVIGLLAGILQHAGEIDADAPVSELVPEIAGTPYRGATIRDLLDMRSGVSLDEDQRRAYAVATNWDPFAPDDAPRGLHDFLAGLTGRAAPHGGPFSYISANTDLLDWVIERATARDVASVISERLWEPMGAEHGAYITLDRRGAARCAGGLCATARDFARIGQLLVDGGRNGHRQVAPGALLDDLLGAGDPGAWANGEWGAAFAPISRAMRYRSGWYIVDDQPGCLFAMGIHGQNLFVDRVNRIVMAKLSAWSEPTDYMALPLTHRAFAEIRRGLTDP